VATVEALEAMGEPRLRIIALTGNVGGGEARNVGVLEAKGEWIAFLDDDDEWLPRKIASQIEVVEASKNSNPIVSCRMIVHDNQSEYIWPRRLPRPDEHLSEYLFARSGPFQGEGLIGTPTLMVSRRLLEDVPFRKLPKHQEWDWLLRAIQIRGTEVEFCAEPLAVWNMDNERPRISTERNWQFSIRWAQEMKGRMTSRGYSAFLLTVVAPQAASVTSLRVYLNILREAICNGSPAPIDLMLFLGMGVIPSGLRQKLRRTLTGS
jgi:glycosyltransferase involved in cell wall biosynthesis